MGVDFVCQCFEGRGRRGRGGGGGGCQQGRDANAFRRGRMRAAAACSRWYTYKRRCMWHKSIDPGLTCQTEQLCQSEKVCGCRWPRSSLACSHFQCILIARAWWSALASSCERDLQIDEALCKPAKETGDRSRTQQTLAQRRPFPRSTTYKVTTRALWCGGTMAARY